MEIRPLIGAFGADIYGVDIAKGLSNQEVEDIHAAWLDHGVVAIRGQKGVTPDAHAAFAAHFGELDTYPFVEPIDADHPQIIPLIKEPEGVMNFGGGWHTDTSYLPEPPSATCLRCIEAPETGGDTLYSDLYAAYDTLSDGLKDLLDGRNGIYTAAHISGPNGIYNTQADHTMTRKADLEAAMRETLHPIIRTHPETGRKALYISNAHSVCLEGMTRQESEPILAYLKQHAVKPERVTRVKWDNETVTLWDNRRAQHYALNDYHGHRREMHRITIKGDLPV